MEQFATKVVEGYGCALYGLKSKRTSHNQRPAHKPLNIRMTLRTKRMLDILCISRNLYQWQIVEEAVLEYIKRQRIDPEDASAIELIKLLEESDGRTESNPEDLL